MVLTNSPAVQEWRRVNTYNVVRLDVAVEQAGD